jgi:hypothetical protein
MRYRGKLCGKDITTHSTHGKGDEVDSLLVPYFVAADAHAGFGCYLKLSTFHSKAIRHPYQ